MSALTSINSSAQWRQVVSSHAIVIADFYATWCGPCKMIAPTFDSLATKYAKPGKIAFAKVDVDAQGDVAQQYSVRAMPTFLVLRNGSVIDTIQGANPPALTAAVEKAVKLAGVGAGAGAVFKTAGQRLGGSGVTGSGGNAGRSVARSRMVWDFKKLVDAVIAFFGLYFISLFSVSCFPAVGPPPGVLTYCAA
ncbi:thioredoxin-domain-containing protein [Trichocladium antarcticum]|uniref:Thioredoxin-domain-containing protein n=1 Tax=Trichocladium antarcticum TaxID=1450529 RepID=A0AAN6UPP5_9PEZI|nr:thioredoxin-domain-containing protein [Trichocladium antarcticum]